MDGIEINLQFERVLNFVNQTNQSIFLTGKAGTGKTTLLKYIKANTFKQLSIIAPTGVAAINAGGSTIHSFFQFPFSPFIPAFKESGEIDTSKNSLLAPKYNAQRLAIFRNLELLIIDEVSMVRADMLDQIDMTLRQIRKKNHLPFGGVQVLLIGDMYQLPPVVQQEEWKMLSQFYKSPYFFDSHVLINNPTVFIELEKIYRQSETAFIELLNKVRNNQLDTESLALLNSFYKPIITENDYQNNITLTTHNRKADEINDKNLNAIKEKSFKYKSKVEGVFSDKNFPADGELILKKGTRVMFLKNNVEKNYYNGKIGIVVYLDDDIIKVKCDDDKYEIEVGKETWTNVAYKLDKSTKQINEEVLGTFSQYPLRLAWAITIHKSQGLTFDNLIIDAAESFSSGQVYVALSRCRSLKGLTLSTMISPKSLLNDLKILNFSTTKQTNEQVNSIFNSSQRNYVKSVLLNLFDFSDQFQHRKDLGGIIQMYKSKINHEGLVWSANFFETIETIVNLSNKFKDQLESLINQAIIIEKDEVLQNRIKKASVYFETEIKKSIDDLKKCLLISESKEAANEINEILQLLFDSLFLKHELIKVCINGFVFNQFLNQKLKLIYPDFKINIYASSKNTKLSIDVQNPKLYRELLILRDQICNDEQKPIYLVANAKTITELTNYLPTNKEHLLKISGFGEAKVNAFGSEFLKIIQNYMIENNLESKMHLLKLKKEKKPKKEKSQKLNDEFYSPNDNFEKVNTKEQTFRLFEHGFNVEEIAQQRKLSINTIQSHLVTYIANGELKIDKLVDKEKQKLILKALENFDYNLGMTPIKNKLSNDVSYSDIRFMLAYKINESK